LLTGENFRANLRQLSLIGARSWSIELAAATTANVGKRFAILLKSKVISAPVVRQPIHGGRGQISGAFTVEQTPRARRSNQYCRPASYGHRYRSKTGFSREPCA
jgi:hypothetical protein